MDNILYSKNLVKAEDSPDGDSPLNIYVTKETNCYAVWIDGFNGIILADYSHYEKDRMIERAVHMTLPECFQYDIGNYKK